MNKSKIECTDETWNPVTGCTKFADVQCHPERLDQPLRWKRPRMVFVNSMSDLFHEEVPDDFIRSVFFTMAIAHEHTFQILTKRPERMLKLLTDGFGDNVTYIEDDDTGASGNFPWPLTNVWLGVSVEDQATADARIPLLLQTPAAVRLVSIDPMLGPVDLNSYFDSLQHQSNEVCKRPGLDKIIVSGESGPNARPMHPGWALIVRTQCKDAGVPFFLAKSP